MVDNIYDAMVRLLTSPTEDGGSSLALEPALDLAERALLKLKPDSDKYGGVWGAQRSKSEGQFP